MCAFVVGAQAVIVEEHGLTYAITLNGTMDVGHLLQHMQSKLGRRGGHDTSKPITTIFPTSQEDGKGDGKAKGKKKAEATDRKAQCGS